MPLSFHKMHANGDDFVIVDSRNSANPMTSALAQRLGDRHRGIGFNQLAVVLDCDDAAALLDVLERRWFHAGCVWQRNAWCRG